jgi:hypothetical protein
MIKTTDVVYLSDILYTIGGWGGVGVVSSYVLVYTAVPLPGMGQIFDQWDAIFINLLYQWVDNLACHYINGW